MEKYLEWDDVWQGLAVATVLVALGLTLTAILEPHNVDYYYISRRGGADVVTCVYAHWTWETDDRAFCSNNPAEALDFATKANAMIAQVHPK